jgi:hypothetical protein
MLQHSVIFKLRHPAHSEGESHFLHAAQQLRNIPGVSQFGIFRQVSPQNSFKLGISMEFLDHAALEHYRLHPIHGEFVSNYWRPEVEDFLEIDYVALSLA